MRPQTQIGSNKTGVATSPKLVKSMLEGTLEFLPSGIGDEREIAHVREEYVKDAEPIASRSPSQRKQTTSSVFASGSPRPKRARSSTAAQGETLAVKSRRILVVADHNDARKALCELLERSGATVLAAGGIDEAMAQVEAKPDIVLSDLGLPGRKSLELARRLRVHRGRNTMRLIALTGFVSHSVIAQAIAAGFDEILQKPLLPQTLEIFIGA